MFFDVSIPSFYSGVDRFATHPVALLALWALAVFVMARSIAKHRNHMPNETPLVEQIKFVVFLICAVLVLEATVHKMLLPNINIPELANGNPLWSVLSLLTACIATFVAIALTAFFIVLKEERKPLDPSE